MKRRELLARLRVPPGTRVRLADWDTGWTRTKVLEAGYEEKLKKRAQRVLKQNLEALTEAQELLWADDRHAILVVLQAMDAGGKDGAIKHVMSGLNPQGVRVTSFKQPSAEELDHDFLWRHVKALPERGQIGIFNRSHYEEVLVVRVHPELVERRRLPEGPRGQRFWQARYEVINAFERHLVESGTIVVKVFLHISKAEQKRRFLARIADPRKRWKFSPGDVAERAHWGAYMKAFEHALSATSTRWAPWYVVPADHKWAARAAVADILTTTVRELHLAWPRLSSAQKKELDVARRVLERERD